MSDYIIEEKNYLSSQSGEPKLTHFWHYYFLTVGSHWVDFKVTENETLYQLSDTHFLKWAYLFYNDTVENLDKTPAEKGIEQRPNMAIEVSCLIMTTILEIPRVILGFSVAAWFTAIHYVLEKLCGDFTVENFFMPNATITIPELFQKYFAEVMIEMGKEILQIIPEIVVYVAQKLLNNENIAQDNMGYLCK